MHTSNIEKSNINRELRESYPRFSWFYDVALGFGFVGAASAVSFSGINPELYSPITVAAGTAFACTWAVAHIVRHFLAADIEQCERMRAADARIAARRRV